jgi:hypothetical protein
VARRADRYTILSSVTHTGTTHGTSAYHMLTGHDHFSLGSLRHPSPNDYPSVGCAVARFGRQPQDMPPHVALPSVLHDGEMPGQGPGFLGQRYAPFQVLADPTRRDFSIDTLTLPADVSRRRLGARVGLRAALDRRAEEEARRSGSGAIRRVAGDGEGRERGALASGQGG